MTDTTPQASEKLSFDRERFKRLVHYVIWRAGHRDGIGATKLSKVLWFSEARTFVLTGKPIAGATYIRDKHGPVPRELMPIWRELEAEDKIRAVEPKRSYDRTQLTALKPPKPLPTENERQTVDYWIDQIDADHSATAVKEDSRDYAWEIAEMGEVVPYFAILSDRVRAPDDEEMKWARQRARDLELP